MILDGPEIVRRREALGMSQADLAHKVGVRASTLCQYETGKHPRPRHPKVGLQLAEALECRLADIATVGNDEDKAKDRAA